MGLRGASGSLYPGADIYRSGAVPVGVVASIHGAHLHSRATVGLQRQRPRRLHSSALKSSFRGGPRAADAQILPGGTAYISGTGMCGDYDSVIGMEKAPSVRRFVTKMPSEKKAKPAEGEATLCGVFVAIEDATGLARQIEPVRLGGRPTAHWL